MPVTCVFLCGGIGKRMIPLTEDKFMFRFLGRTLLEHQIGFARQAGIGEFIVIANPLNIDRIRNVAGEGVQYAVQRGANGMADALLSAKGLLAGKEILVVNPNDIVELQAYESVIKSGADTCILGREVTEYFSGGYMVVEGDKMKGIIEKPGKGNEPSNLVNIVIHLHRDADALLRELENTSSGNDDAYERALDNIAKTGSVKVARYSGKWIPIKYPWHLLAATEHFLSGAKRSIAPTAKISQSATIEGNVVIGDNARILENAVIRGPCYIGKNSLVGNGSLIWKNTHIGNNCVVGYKTEIKNSYIGNNCWFHSNYIGDSVIDDDCSFGAGTITANFRLDERNVKVRIRNEDVDTGRDKLGAVVGHSCKTGIHAGIMPGIRLGPNSFVGPYVCLGKDLEPNKTALADAGTRIVENKIALSEEKKKELMTRLERL